MPRAKKIFCSIQPALVSTCLFLFLMISFCVLELPAANETPVVTHKKLDELGVKQRTDQAITYLKNQQKDGTWMNHPGVTALVLQGMFTSHRKYNRLDGPFMKQPIQYLLRLQDSEGAIYDPESRQPNKNYCTSLAILALSSAKDPTFKTTIEKGCQYLIKAQADEGEKFDPKEDYFYGGIGYGGSLRPDLSNLQLALDALTAGGIDKSNPVYKKALIFVSRCQDTESNPQSWTKGSGGFVYSPAEEANKALPVQRKEQDTMVPYGSMTFAGLKSLIFCNVAKDDPRVQDTIKWIRKNYSVKQHPGMGQVSLFYYYYTMAKALSVAGLEKIKLDNGDIVDWKLDLAQEIITLQNKDGSWVNPQGRFMEGMPILATAYAINALNILNNLE